MLKKTEDDIKDTKLTKEQKTNQKKTLENKLASDPNNATTKTELDTVLAELRKIEIKEKALEEALTKIKKEQEKFPKDTTKSISATEAQKASQEAERLAFEGNGIIEVQQNKEENEKTDKEIKENFAKIETEINNKIYSNEEGEKNKIDNPQTLKEIRDKISKF